MGNTYDNPTSTEYDREDMLKENEKRGDHLRLEPAERLPIDMKWGRGSEWFSRGKVIF